MHPAFRILGPLEVALSDERVVALGRRERALLGVLLLKAGEVVSVERLIDGVWGEVPPSSAKHMVHEYVSRLRTALGDASRIQTRVPGYRVTCSDEELDARLFSTLAATARAAARADEHAAALRTYEQALALWRGDALAGVELEGAAQIDAARLDQQRRLVAEERIDSALALGKHRELIPELERRVDEEPMRERARAQLMLALYRAGRQVEALECYREGRALLVDQAGVEPGRELRELERAILQHDPSLDLETVGPAAKRSASAPRAGRRWTRAAAVAGALLAAAAGGLVFVLGQSDSAPALPRIDANHAGAIDPGNNRLVDQVRVGAGPGRLAAGFGSLWVVNDFENTVSRIDPATGGTQTIDVDGDPTGIAVGAGFVWVACTATRSVDRISPENNKVTQSIPVGNGPSGIAISPGRLWVTNRFDDNVTEIDSKTGKPLGTLSAGASPSDIAYGLGALWIANESSSTVRRIDPATRAIQEFPVGNGPVAVAVGHHAIWVANSLDGSVSRIDPNSHVVDTFPVGPGPSSVLVSDGSVWIADSYGDRIVRMDPATGHIRRTIGVRSGPQSLTSIGGRVWLSARATSAVHRGGTERVFDVAPDSLDEALGYAPSAWSVFSLTSDGLVGFKRVGGLDGSTLVPDLATSLPSPTNGGRTYTFQLRRGVHYSNGDPVRASDFRRALERDFRIGSPRLDYYAGLLGADACSKKRCDLSDGVLADDRKGTVILNLRRPDPEFAYKLALPFAFPVPPGTSLTKPARLGVPGTGPYMIQSYKRSRVHKSSLVVLVRNPRFREWYAAAQPDGYPDRIQLASNHNFGKQLSSVENGDADVMQAPFPASRLNEIKTRYAARVHVFQAWVTWAIFLNTRRPPFDNLKARQALNYAIDRRKALVGFGGVDAAALTCQILPPGLTGYRRYCPYTRHSNSQGIWTAPDLAKARKLVIASGTAGQKVTVWTPSKHVPFLRFAAKLFVATLTQLGYSAKLKTVPGTPDIYFTKVQDPHTQAQAGEDAWYPDFPAPSNTIGLFTCGPGSENNADPSHLCDPLLDKFVDRTLRRQTAGASAASNASWSKADRIVTDAAAWVPLVNSQTVVVVSRRVHNVQANTNSRVLIDQLWLR